ncbi:MAG: DAK2 domain-containing protein [Chloroflexota bacterium]|nr:DAK2 domain-containing protein [Chloroflexota bacterium]
MLDAFAFSAALLERHRDAVNALNVFPVPDGDTGTNMALTMRGALEAVDGLDPNATTSAVAAKLAYGALMGARGNSGVILSQFFRGFASGLGNAEEIDGRDIARALQGSRDTAYKAVMRPVEGTMLTVIRAASEAAKKKSRSHPSVLDVLAAAVDGAQVALDNTPQQLDILRQAGVVDAGGQGVVYILDGLARSAQGETELPSISASSTRGPGENMAFLDMVGETHGEDAFGYCTNFMVFGDHIDPDRCRQEIAAMGDSAVIVGDESMLKVHIHTTDPGEVLQYATRLGDLDQIKIDNMSRQTEALSAQRNARTDSPGDASARDAITGGEAHETIAVIAVAAGEGISEALRSLGASAIVRGGQTMNPSTQELLDAVDASGADEVILLPNNKNIIMAANQVDALTTKTVGVVPTRSIPAALSALTAFSADRDLAANIETMEDATADCLAISITRAVRAVDLNGVTVSQGELIGLVDDELAVAGTDDADVFQKTLAKSGAHDPELFTIFVGEDVSPDDAQEFETALVGAWPDAEVETHPGGQPHYRYIISIE